MFRDLKPLLNTLTCSSFRLCSFNRGAFLSDRGALTHSHVIFNVSTQFYAVRKNIVETTLVLTSWQ